jgi:hypothetical protein
LGLKSQHHSLWGFSFDNRKTEIIKIRKMVVKVHTNFVLNIGEENLKKFHLGAAGTMYVTMVHLRYFYRKGVRKYPWPHDVYYVYVYTQVLP